MNKQNNKKGFTLIELLIYITLAGMILTAAINLEVNVSRGQARAQQNHELYINAQVAINQIDRKIREADDVITASSTFGTNPGVLTLDYPGTGTDIIFNTYPKEIMRGGTPVTITKLRIKEGSADPIDLTSDNVDVTDFTLSNLTIGGNKNNIGIELTLEREDASFSIETAVSVRK
ncbi:prepilin-type N-terminal cleavage/methylation domain-containing protein [Patescibacteria group bacterium]|nr:prepilin-type N-terminal cleavage/methylation domain-containing protein [Patescibacteria group bacterium]MBU1703134.1 prepilin-type N-terminal cleavage/methylation domain-containing protein [Patescibacteria group bacterium]MBU1954136.1 prepilin-type N-terminal cleavage/methylation domain-containing protein [Patescibacteria group bacterium]